MATKEENNNPSSCAIITFFGATNPCKKIDA